MNNVIEKVFEALSDLEEVRLVYLNKHPQEISHIDRALRDLNDAYEWLNDVEQVDE